MTPQILEQVLEQVATGNLTPKRALQSLKKLPFEELDVACLDHHRNLRQGSPEVIYCEFKTPTEIVTIAEAILKQGSNLLCTRLQEDGMEALRNAIDGITINQRSRLASLIQTPQQTPGKIGVICAGTSDLPIAEEARLTLEFYGITTFHRHDIGVAGLQRVLSITNELSTCDAIIVVAGMEGALASVVAGLVACPVIAVPTSVGYGANLNGVTTLLAMLNTCAAGVTVVNINNGFGAASAAFRMLHSRSL